MPKSHLWRTMLLGTMGAIIAVPVLSLAAPTAQDATKTAAPTTTTAKHDDHPALNTNPGPLEAMSIGDIKNALKWNDHVISGSCPYGDLGFKSLAEKGVKTIVSVDGAKPDVAMAHKYKMRYVHIPIEYSGIEREDALKIIRAVRDLPGPIFIHCHHGIHRSAAATALAVIATSDGKFDNSKGEEGLKQSGTGLNYKGLWGVVRDFKVPTKEEIDAADNSFPEIAPVAPMAAAMVDIDTRWEHLRDAKALNWQVSAEHPDIDPAHEALLLHEGFRELHRSPQTRTYPADFAQMMKASEEAALALEKAIRAKDEAGAQVAFDAVKNSCGGCHKLYRDTE